MEAKNSSSHRTHSLNIIQPDIKFKLSSDSFLSKKFYIQKPLPVLCPISETEYIRWTVLPTNTLEKILNALLTTTTHTVTAHRTERLSDTMRSFRSKTEKTLCSTCHDTIPEQCLRAIPVCRYGWSHIKHSRSWREKHIQFSNPETDDTLPHKTSLQFFNIRLTFNVRYLHTIPRPFGTHTASCSLIEADTALH